MEFRLYLQMLQRGWWVIVLTALVALSVSLGISYASVPQYQATASFVLSPGELLLNGPDVVRSLDTLDRPSVVATYAEVMNSRRILEESAAFLGLQTIDLEEDYTILAVVLPESSVLQLTVSGPNPQVCAAVANTIGYQSIAFARRLNQVYDLEFLDTAVPPLLPFSPVPLRDASLAFVIGLAVGAMFVILSEQIRMPLEALRQRITIDHSSSAFTRRYFQNRLEEDVARSTTGNIGLGLIQLDGLSDLIETLPPIISQQLLHEVTRKLRNELRGNDIVGRWADVSFAVMLPSTPEGPAERTLERIRQALSDPIILSQTNESVRLQPCVAVKVSEPQEPVVSLIHRAEEALKESRQKSFTKKS